MQPANPHLHNNDDDDDEEDEDYVPPNQDSSDDEEEPDLKRTRTASPTLNEEDEEEKARKREKAAAIYASFQEPSGSASTSQTAVTIGEAKPTPKPALVKIEKKYLFAGKEIMHVIEVPEDSLEAKKWPRWVGADQTMGEPNQQLTSSTPLSATERPESIQQGGSERTKESPPSASATSTPPHQAPAPHHPDPTSSTSPALPAPTPTPSEPDPSSKDATVPRKPPPKRRKSALPALPSSSSKPQKLTTLAKSAMDWQAHLSSSQASASGPDAGAVGLEANRKEGGGGYLERMEFLKRVEERREGLFEEGKKGGKRKR